MTTTPKVAVPFWTKRQVQAKAQLLDGSKSRVARAAAQDDQVPKAEVGTTGELWLYGVVGGWWRGFDAESVANALRGLDVDTLYVRIHSPGGNAADGVAIGNLLRNHKAHVVVVVDGLAASSASVIAVAGEEIVMCPGSQMMLHDASTFAGGNAADLREAADWIDGQSANYAGVYAYRAGGTPEQWREVMRANNGWGTWYTADDAVSAGLADSVGTRPAVGSPPVAPEDDLADEEFWAKAAHDLELLDQCVHPAARAAWQGEPPKPPTESSGGSKKNTTQEGSNAMAFSAEQLTTMRQELGLPEDADEATITAALSEALKERAEPAAPATAEAPQVPEGMKLVSETIFEDVTAKAERGAKAAEQLLAMQCKTVLDKYKDRFPATPEARAKWEADYRRDPEGTEAYLAKAAVLVPTSEIGHAEDSDTDTPVSLADIRNDPTYQSWKVS